MYLFSEFINFNITNIKLYIYIYIYIYICVSVYIYNKYKSILNKYY